MESISKDLRHKIVSIDPLIPQYIKDLFIVLDAYKNDGMGESPPYTESERSDLETLFKTHQNVEAFLLYVDNKIAGATICFKTFSTFSAKNVLNIHDICVLKEFRGSGYGRELMRAAITRAINLRCGKVTLEVREDNLVAKNLYSDLGFMESSPVMNFWHKNL